MVTADLRESTLAVSYIYAGFRGSQIGEEQTQRWLSEHEGGSVDSSFKWFPHRSTQFGHAVDALCVSVVLPGCTAQLLLHAQLRRVQEGRFCHSTKHPTNNTAKIRNLSFLLWTSDNEWPQTHFVIYPKAGQWLGVALFSLTHSLQHKH